MRVSIHRAYAVLLAFFTTALVLITLTSSLSSVLQTTGGTNDTTSGGISPSQSMPQVTLLAEHLLPAQRILQAALMVVAPPLPQGLVDIRTNRPLEVCRRAHCVLQPAVRRRVVSLSLASQDATNPYTVIHPISMREFFSAGGGQSTLAFPVAIPVDGNTEFYPNDVYQLSTRLDLTLPNLGVRTQDGKVHAMIATYSFDPGDLGKSLDIHSGFACSDQSNCGRNVADVTLARKAPEQWFIESVSLVPIIFALLFLHLLFLHPRYRKAGIESFLLPLIAAILAILPLRLVLVPSTIEGLTRVDLALGAGLVLTVAVALAKYIWEIWHVDDGGSSRAGEEEVDVTPAGP